MTAAPDVTGGYWRAEDSREVTRYRHDRSSGLCICRQAQFGQPTRAFLPISGQPVDHYGSSSGCLCGACYGLLTTRGGALGPAPFRKSQPRYSAFPGMCRISPERVVCASTSCWPRCWLVGGAPAWVDGPLEGPGSRAALAVSGAPPQGRLLGMAASDLAYKQPKTRKGEPAQPFSEVAACVVGKRDVLSQD